MSAPKTYLVKTVSPDELTITKEAISDLTDDCLRQNTDGAYDTNGQDMVTVSNLILTQQSTGFTTIAGIATAPEKTMNSVLYYPDENATTLMSTAVVKKTTDPTTDDIPEGTFKVYNNLTSGDSSIWINIAGALKKVVFS